MVAALSHLHFPAQEHSRTTRKSKKPPKPKPHQWLHASSSPEHLAELDAAAHCYLGAPAIRVACFLGHAIGHERRRCAFTLATIARGADVSHGQASRALTRLKRAGAFRVECERRRQREAFGPDGRPRYGSTLWITPRGSCMRKGYAKDGEPVLHLPAEAWTEWLTGAVSWGGRRPGAGRPRSAVPGAAALRKRRGREIKMRCAPQENPNGFEGGTNQTALQNNKSSREATTHFFSKEKKMLASLDLNFLKKESEVLPPPLPTDPRTVSWDRAPETLTYRPSTNPLLSIPRIHPPFDTTLDHQAPSPAPGTEHPGTAPRKPNTPIEDDEEALARMIGAIDSRLTKRTPAREGMVEPLFLPPLDPAESYGVSPTTLSSLLPNIARAKALVAGYRRAHEEVFGKDPMLFARGGVERSKIYPRLLKCAEAMVDEEVSPYAWALWMLTRDKRDGKTPSPLTKVFCTSLVRRWHGWFRKEGVHETGVRVRITRRHLEQLYRRQEATSIWRGAMMAHYGLPCWYTEMRNKEIEQGFHDPLELYPRIPKGYREEEPAKPTTTAPKKAR